MITITANRLTDGRVVYLDGCGGWTAHLHAAAAFDDEESALEAVTDTRDVVGLYSIHIENRAPVGAKRLRERIRRDGPTAGSSLLLSANDG